MIEFKKINNDYMQLYLSENSAGSRQNLPVLKDEDLTDQEKREVERLKQQEKEVKAHEEAHRQAGGRHIRGAIQYEYKTGPDGKRYIAGGEVSIDTSEENDPDKTVKKMQTVRRAALAPIKPSATDRAVAAEASGKENKARREASESKNEEMKIKDGQNVFYSGNIYSTSRPEKSAIFEISSGNIDFAV